MSYKNLEYELTHLDGDPMLETCVLRFEIETRYAEAVCLLDEIRMAVNEIHSTGI